MKFDHESVGVEQWRARDLTGVVESDRRTREANCSARRRIIVPGELAVLDLQVTDQRNQEAAGHGIDEWRTALDRVKFPGKGRIECLGRHGLEPARKAERCRHGRWQPTFQFFGTAERQGRGIIRVGEHCRWPSCKVAAAPLREKSSRRGAAIGNVFSGAPPRLQNRG
jgi:hypothetical protein